MKLFGQLSGLHVVQEALDLGFEQNTWQTHTKRGGSRAPTSGLGRLHEIKHVLELGIPHQRCQFQIPYSIAWHPPGVPPGAMRSPWTTAAPFFKSELDNRDTERLGACRLALRQRCKIALSTKVNSPVSLRQ